MAAASAVFSSGASTVPRYCPRFLMIETRHDRSLAAFFLGDCGIPNEGRRGIVALLNSFSDGEADQRADKGACCLFVYLVGSREEDETRHDNRKRHDLKCLL